MKTLPLLATLGLSLRALPGLPAGTTSPAAAGIRTTTGPVKPPGADEAPTWFIAQAQPGGGRIAATGQPGPENRPAQAAAFAAFAPRVTVRWDQFIASLGGEIELTLKT